MLKIVSTLAIAAVASIALGACSGGGLSSLPATGSATSTSQALRAAGPQAHMVEFALSRHGAPQAHMVEFALASHGAPAPHSCRPDTVGGPPKCHHDDLAQRGAPQASMVEYAMR